MGIKDPVVGFVWKHTQSALIQGQAILRPEQEQLVPNSESYFKASEFSHLIDFPFDLPLDQPCSLYVCDYSWGPLRQTDRSKVYFELAFPPVALSSRGLLDTDCR